jgi:Zn-finger nucleic acid-binding protein
LTTSARAVRSVRLTMAAETLSCPMCGAPTSTDATRCEHCGARLATVACPSCFGMMFLGAKFCSHCGARADRTEVEAAKAERCPRCGSAMQAATIGKTTVRECLRCEGLWVDTASLERICADREKQAAVMGVADPEPAPGSVVLEEKVRYIPCPICGKLMNRVNFAHWSGVVVDICKGHGTWFDRDELRRVVEFIRAGGLEVARAREIADLEDQKRDLKAGRVANAWDTTTQADESRYAGCDLGISVIGSLLKSLMR